VYLTREPPAHVLVARERESRLDWVLKPQQLRVAGAAGEGRALSVAHPCACVSESPDG
jgi:hypothetical protein